MPEYSIEIEERGRCGVITYREGSHLISFDYEFGGGDCLAFIFGPKQEMWDTTYPWAIGRQHQIFTDMSKEVIAKRANSCLAQIELRTGTVAIIQPKKGVQ
ncbi:MAG: hypothetical protein P4L53_12420 [Candidatus Obscuribacterales bacterium]|nr:hypothetical protein [Candidatus Obscuribacterales bacterium]